MIVIFLLSAQTGRQSGKLSSEVSDTIIKSSGKLKAGVQHVVKSTNAVAVKQTSSAPTRAELRKKQQQRRDFTNSVRDVAHGLNYCVLAILFFFSLKQHGINTWKVLCVTVLFCVLYSISDEFHQSFVPGRGVEFKDGVYDFMGTLIGVSVSLVVGRLAKKRDV